MKEHKVGYVLNYFGHISVAAVNITSGILQVGDTVHFKGNTTDFEEIVKSIQIELAPVSLAKAGESIGVKVGQKVRKRDEVYRVIDN